MVTRTVPTKFVKCWVFIHIPQSSDAITLGVIGKWPTPQMFQQAQQPSASPSVRQRLNVLINY